MGWNWLKIILSVRTDLFTLFLLLLKLIAANFVGVIAVNLLLDEWCCHDQQQDLIRCPETNWGCIFRRLTNFNNLLWATTSSKMHWQRFLYQKNGRNAKMSCRNTNLFLLPPNPKSTPLTLWLLEQATNVTLTPNNFVCSNGTQSFE